MHFWACCKPSLSGHELGITVLEGEEGETTSNKIVPYELIIQITDLVQF